MRLTKAVKREAFRRAQWDVVTASREFAMQRMRRTLPREIWEQCVMQRHMGSLYFPLIPETFWRDLRRAMQRRAKWHMKQMHTRRNRVKF